MKNNLVQFVLFLMFEYSLAGIIPGQDGNYRFDDMILTEAQYQQRFGKAKIAFSGIADNQYRWPNGGK